MRARPSRASEQVEPQLWCKFALGVVLVLAVLLPARSLAQNITYSEIKFGVWAHDITTLGGRERGADSAMLTPAGWAEARIIAAQQARLRLPD